jgi:hypothetical protein
MGSYVDSSLVVAVMLQQGDWRARQSLLRLTAQLRSSPLLEAEVRAAHTREHCPSDPDEFLEKIDWVVPDGAPSERLREVLAHGYVRGADLWHLACALVAFGKGNGHDFLSLDERQRELAAALGFRVLPETLD